LNAIIPNLSRASHSCKKYLVFLSANVSRFPGFIKFHLEPAESGTWF